MTLNDTPRGMRLHIGIFGKRNTGKSTMMNALTNQPIALVSDIAGTTTDPVYKSMEIKGIGPVVFIDTAGFDDVGTLGEKRVSMTEDTIKKTDIALFLFTDVPDIEKEWIEKLKEKKIPIIPIINKSDILQDTEKIFNEVKKITNDDPVIVSAEKKIGITEIRKQIIYKLPEGYDGESLTGNLVSEDDTILLVMPQDIQAPKNRLILPQVQTIRELLDKKCTVICCTTDKLKQTLGKLQEPPELIITDSQVFPIVWEQKPKESKITSFSVLMAGMKGDIEEFIKGAKAISNLKANSSILIAEACTHAPLPEDIGREKIPNMLRKKLGDEIKVKIATGRDFPKNLKDFDIIIHCGACMFNRKYVLSRIEEAKKYGIPMTNYGCVIAYMSGILDKISWVK